MKKIDKPTPALPLKKEGSARPFFKELAPHLMRGRMRARRSLGGGGGGIYYGDWSFVLIKDNRAVYASKDKGLAPLLFCLKKYKQQMRGAVVYDKIVGRAAALLLDHSGVKKALTPVISRGALGYLRKNGVAVEYGKAVKNIMSRAGTDLCPMEKLSAGKTAEELLEILMAERKK